MKISILLLLAIFIPSTSSGSDISAINLSWNTVAFQSEYTLHLHLDEPLEDGDGQVLIKNCISSDILGLRTSVTFNGVCPSHPELGSIPLSNILSFEIEAATYGNWEDELGRQSATLKNEELDDSIYQFPSFEINQTDHYVYVLAGQSNMVGAGLYHPILDKLNPTGNKIPPNVEYYVEGERTLEFSTNSDFGPEISFINNIANKHPDKKITILKHAVGGTNISQWLEQDGLADQLISDAVTIIGSQMIAIKAILWMQGEADVILQSKTYKNDLKQLIEKFRSISVAGGNARSLPFILGRIHHYIDDDPRLDSALNFVRKDQEEVASEDDFSYMIDTDKFSEEELNPWHFDGQSQLSFGQCFYNIVENLTESTDCPLLSLELL